ncbi:MAG: heavy metal-binding domain-containing protein [Pseudomonadota bacterium]
MKTSAIAREYGFDQPKFERWIQQNSDIASKPAIVGGLAISDADVESAVADFQAFLDEHERLVAAEKAEAKQQAEQAEIEAQRKQRALSSMLITSGFNFDGFKITKYSGYISGDDVVQIDRGSQGFFSDVTDVGASLMSSLAKIRRNALIELKEAAYELGCNAVIGVDFDYLTLDPETANAGGGTLYLPYVFGVTANGNAVVIEEASSTN